MERLMKHINRIHRAYIFHMEEAFSDHGLKGNQFSYLIYIHKLPGISQDDLAKELVVNKSSVTRQVCKLEKQGFIIRKQDENDKRINRIFLADKGEKVFDLIRKEIRTWNKSIQKDLDPEIKLEPSLAIMAEAAGQFIDIKE